MPKIIRSSCFETNSSSTHSITIDSTSNESLYNPVPPYMISEEGVFNHTCHGEYGWEIDTYTDVGTKIDYMSIYVRDWSKERQLKFMEVLENVVREHSGVSEVNFNFGDYSTFEYNGNPYKNYNEAHIDHQSVEDSDYDYLFENNGEKLKAFLFAPNSYFQTDNDNH